MKTSKIGLNLIKKFEGLSLVAYEDAVGVLTIGFGHTAAAGPPNPRRGVRITEAEAEAILARDLGKYEDAVLSALNRQPTQNQFDAMVSLCFNIGPGAFAGSRVVKAFNAGDMEAAGQAFLGWTRAGGAQLRGLKKRREAEKRLFLSQTGSAKWAVAGSGGAAVGSGLVASFGDAAVQSLGYSFADLMTWQFLATVAVITGVLAIIAVAAMGHDRREKLWQKIFGGWLS